MDTERKLNVHKTFRRPPGRLLNVLCTFNLRPMSRGSAGDIIFVYFIKLQTYFIFSINLCLIDHTDIVANQPISIFAGKL